MENYLEFMKTLRTQMNDVEDQAAKQSVEEQMQSTIIQTLQNDLVSAKSEINKLKEDVERMSKEKGEICSKILKNRRKIAYLESDSSSLAQSLELIQQEKNAMNEKLAKMRHYYQKTAEDTKFRLQEQMDCFNSFKTSKEATNTAMETDEREILMSKLNSAKAKLNEVSEMKSKLVQENKKMKQAIEQMGLGKNEIESILMMKDIKTLESNYDILSSDKGVFTEDLHIIQDQFKILRGISHVIKCECGKEYEVDTK